MNVNLTPQNIFSSSFQLKRLSHFHMLLLFIVLNLSQYVRLRGLKKIANWYSFLATCLQTKMNRKYLAIGIRWSNLWSEDQNCKNQTPCYFLFCKACLTYWSNSSKSCTQNNTIAVYDPKRNWPKGRPHDRPQCRTRILLYF